MEAAHLDYEASIDALKLAQLSLKAIREGLQTRYGHSPSDGVCDASIETRPLAEHPQVRKRQAEANASHAMAEWSEQRPQVKLSFLEIGYSRRASDASDRILFELGIPLWDGAKDEARVARADAYQDRVRVQLDARTVRERVLTRQLQTSRRRSQIGISRPSFERDSSGAPEWVSTPAHQAPAYGTQSLCAQSGASPRGRSGSHRFERSLGSAIDSPLNPQLDDTTRPTHA